MIYNSSDYNNDLIISEIQHAPLKMLLFKEDTEYDSILSSLCAKIKYNEKQIISKNLEVYIIPTRYNKHNENVIQHVDYCDFAINILYKKWCIENNKLMRNPYLSKRFMQYIKEIGFLSSDYAVIMIEY